MSEVTEVLDRTITRLRTKGWKKNGYGLPEGPNCVLGAIQYETGTWPDEVNYDISKQPLASAVGNAVQAALPGISIVMFNDTIAQSVDDVISVLEKAKFKVEQGLV